MHKLEKKYMNILIFFITTLLNVIMINNFSEIIKSDYKVMATGLYLLLIPVYILAQIKNYQTLEKVIRIANMAILSAGITAVIAYYISKIVVFINKFSFQSILSQYRSKALFIYLAISFLQPILLPLPEPLTIMAGSSVLGSFNGAVCGFLGTVAGIVTMYFFVRVTGAKFIEKFVSNKQIEKFNEYIKKNETIVILLLFILPMLPDEAICIGAGLTKINAYKFISIAVISKMITAFSLSYSVSLVKLNSMQMMLIAAGILAVKKLIDIKKVKMK